MNTLAIESEVNSESLYLCDGLKYVTPMVLNYEYRLKIAPGFEITGIVSNLESVLIKKLQSFMTCKISVDEVRIFLEDEKSGDLGIVGMKASPDDKIQPNSSCSNKYCEVDVNGALTVYLSKSSDSKMVFYAIRHVIAQAMINYSDTSIINSVSGLRSASYKGPPLSNPRDDYKNDDDGFLRKERSQKSYDSSGLTKIEVVVLATIVSVVVGLIGTIMLSKRIFILKGDNCFAPCDGTGRDRDFVENSEGKRQHDDRDEINSANIQWNVDMNNSLSVIEEDTEAQSIITNQTNLTATKILRPIDDHSIGSLSTVMASNRYIPVT